MLWFKKKKEVIIGEQIQPSLDDILNNPFEIIIHEATKYNYFTKQFEISVFRFDICKWDCLHRCSKNIVGIEDKEFLNLCKDLFGDKNVYGYTYNDYVKQLLFKNREDAEKIIAEFRSYYDTYHIPRAVADRLTSYDEAGGGYPAPLYLKERKGPFGEGYQIKLVK